MLQTSLSLGIPSLAGPPGLGGPTVLELGVIPSMVSAQLSLRRCVGARVTVSAMQVEDGQYPHPKSGYWCVLRFRDPLHYPITGRKLELWSRKDWWYLLPVCRSITHTDSPLASVLKGASKGLFLASAF